MNFSDPKHSADDLVIHAVIEYEPINICSDEILSVLNRWNSRAVLSDPQSMVFSLNKVQHFTISYDAKAGNYFPGEKQNWIAESLTRDVLFKDGICNLDNFTPKIFAISYKVIALEDVEYLLFCPYRSESGNIEGVVVVCVNHYLRKKVIKVREGQSIHNALERGESY